MQSCLYTGPDVIKLFRVVIYEYSCVRVSQTSLSSLVKYLWVRPGAYPRVEHLKGALLSQTQVSPANIRLGWKGLPGTHTLAYYENK